MEGIRYTIKPLRKGLAKLKLLGEMILFSHTLFSLPFAVVAMLIAAQGLPTPTDILWILLAFLGARSGANALNRIVDRKIDAKNPRTRDRHLPRGAVGLWEAVVFVIISFAVLVFSAAMLNPLCLYLSPLALLLFFLYSYTKRFTWACHLILGFISAGAPVGAWIAITGSIHWVPLIFGAANAMWVAGFDIIYACLDVDFDREEGLYSIPAHFGIGRALIFSALLHMGALGLLAVAGIAADLSWLYFLGLVPIAILLSVEHIVVRPDRLESVQFASYSVNQIVALLFLFFSMGDILVL